MHWSAVFRILTSYFLQAAKIYKKITELIAYYLLINNFLPIRVQKLKTCNQCGCKISFKISKNNK